MELNSVLMLIGTLCVAGLSIVATWAIVRYGKSGAAYLKPIESTIDTIQAVATQIDNDPSTESPLEKALRWAHTGVSAAEQLYIAGNLPAEERKQYALNYAKLWADHFGVEWTDTVQKLAEGTIEAAVKYLPKTEDTNTL